MKKSKSIISLFLSGAMILASCSSTTMIQSSPPNAKLYLNGQPVGTTPYTLTDTKIVGSRTEVKIVKEGYEPFFTTITRDEQVDVGAIIGGLFVWVPFLWTMKYQPAHNYELIPYSGDMQQMDQALQPTSTLQPKIERLRDLKQLLDEKILTQEEYEKEKKKVLDEVAK